MAYAVPEGRHGMAAQDAARSIGHGSADQDGQAFAAVPITGLDLTGQQLGNLQVNG